uniref:Small ribosomal subunit protein uS14 n=1 Tax=Catagonus wagneri TaxID=51154 RepID=A0A8C3VZ71_9CETA
MGHQQLYWSHPRKFGQGSRSCRVCSNRHGLIRKYGLNMCRQCFRQYAKDIGFIKVHVRRSHTLLFPGWDNEGVVPWCGL